MAKIRVKSVSSEAGWAFTVEVVEGHSSTVHQVTMSRDYFERFSGSPEDFVRKAFEFLLEREPKEAILSSFDISVISRYFPEFEEEMS